MPVTGMCQKKPSNTAEQPVGLFTLPMWFALHMKDRFNDKTYTKNNELKMSISSCFFFRI